MAKHESTAVNELIDLVSTSKPLVLDGEEDLMFSPPKPKLNSARMTAAMPSQGDVDVEPLPRTRAPNGTQTGVQALPPLPQAHPSASGGVRVSTAPPSRTTTIPPLSQAGHGVPSRPTRPSLPPPARGSTRTAEGTPGPERSARTSAPASMPVAAPFESRPHDVRRDSHPFVANPNPAAPATLDMTSNAAWFEPSTLHDKLESTEETWIGTMQVAKQATTRGGLAKIAIPMGLLVIAGLCIGGFVAFDREHARAKSTTPAHAPSPTAAVAQIAAPAPAAVAPAAGAQPAPPTVEQPAVAQPAVAQPAVAQPAVAQPAVAQPAVAQPAVAQPAVAQPAATQPAVAQPAAPPVAQAAPATTPANLAPAAVDKIASDVAPSSETHAVGSLVDVRIDTQPQGATVMLVDRGRTTFLGTTPISTSVDPARKYDLVFTYANKPTQLEHLDASSTKHVSIVLGKPGNVAKAEVAVAKPAPAAAPVHQSHEIKATPAPAPAAKHETAPAAGAPSAKRVAAATSSGGGTLMISSKPPCEIVVDGKTTGLTTPQRAIALSAGSHKITLINAQSSINKTVAVEISADKATKVIQNLMK